MTQSARTVLFALGVMLSALSLGMLAPALADLDHDGASAHAFFGSAMLGLGAGGIMVLLGRSPEHRLTARSAILLTAGAWAVLAFAAALPLKLSGMEISWTDAIFETTSGLTTTGATVLTGLDDLPRGLLLWRSILQWIGGIGIIVTAMAIWPMLGIGGMQLFRLENSEKSEKVLPRAGQIALAVLLIYLALTFACFLAYLGAGLGAFDAVNHAMTTIATGGFSTRDASLSAFAGTNADLVAALFMVLAGLPFVLYVRAAQGRPDLLLTDVQARGFLMVIAAFAALLTLIITLSPEIAHDSAKPAWRLALVNVISILTGTGYASADFWAWGGASAAVFFMLMFIGGCAGSTTCSVKIFRYQIAFSALTSYIRRMTRPNMVAPVRYRGTVLPPETVRSVFVFIFLFFATFAVSAVLLSFTGLDTVTAISGAATTIANVGPGLGDIIGPAGNFAPLPDAAKWIMTVTMLIGRLEVLVVLVMLTPGFWRR
ncbi:TrkH family potassium uptake protein [Alkalicaulis satelles]|uniref:Trk system potassium uptake protein n=1 Tax=Alkalicaulis satelles TaxID=2609175 RepID=A0A5M6ZMW6_9PROT|nr:TrkH family potassium uptake protein [Alkalicaulis satelles]KAA5804588.1 TrkH family potassium uptake protein [Alkalicaulis satelles]